MESSFLIHSAKGTSWVKKNHKYIAKKNGRYIYNKTEQDARIEAEQKQSKQRADEYFKSGKYKRDLDEIQSDIDEGKYWENKLHSVKFDRGEYTIDTSDRYRLTETGHRIISRIFSDRSSFDQFANNTRKNLSINETRKKMLTDYAERQKAARRNR